MGLFANPPVKREKLPKYDVNVTPICNWQKTDMTDYGVYKVDWDRIVWVFPKIGDKNAV